MQFRSLIIRIVIFLCLPHASFCQNSERVVFDKTDSTTGYYLAIAPAIKDSKGVIVLLTSFAAPESLLPETKLHNVAYANDLLTIVVPMKQKIYADNSSVDRINTVLNHVLSRFSTDTSAFALAGYDEAGNIALRYTEICYEQPGKFPMQPKAVFGIDTPVDLFGLWRWSENQVKKNYWPGAVGDAKFYLNALEKDNGTIYNNPERFKFLTPFDAQSTTTGNEQFLKDVAVRLYYDTDIEWQLKNRRNSYYDTKMLEGSELIKRLLLAGNNKAEFVAAQRPGIRSNGVRHPTALSIVDEVECIQWLKKSLHIFDARTWVPPYHLQSPAGWERERFSLPPGFAPDLGFKGVEDIRFAPGWADVKSEEHWAYCFLWWLNGNVKQDVASLQSALEKYYSGLVLSNVQQLTASKKIPTTVAVKKIKTNGNDIETYSGTINMLDYHSQQPMILNCMIHVKNSPQKNYTAIFFELSPRPYSHPVWQKMDAIGESLK
jgi:hypothetical protein